MFVCAHPAIDPAARAALMLQTVLGLDAARIASAFLVAPAALSQRLVRAKTKIRSAGIAFEVPGADAVAGSARPTCSKRSTPPTAPAGTTSPAPTRERSGLAREALDAGGDARPPRSADAAEAWGLLALLAFCQSRAGARRDGAGDYVPLLAQDTSLWDRELLGVGEARAAPRRGARRARRVPARGGDPVGAHAAPARRERSRRGDRRALRRAGRDAADDRRDRQPRLRRRRRPRRRAPAARRSPRSLPRTSTATSRTGPRSPISRPPRATPRRRARRASAPSASAPIRRCGAFSCARRTDADGRGRRSAPSILEAPPARSPPPPPCASSSA